MITTSDLTFCSNVQSLKPKLGCSNGKSVEYGDTDQILIHLYVERLRVRERKIDEDGGLKNSEKERLHEIFKGERKKLTTD